MAYPLKKSFYQREDVLTIGRELLGKFLFTNIGGEMTGGMIIETESYKGAEDKACHAYNNRRTARTEVMFAPGGVAYIYFCYGMHHLFNIVTNKKDIPHAVLIRAIQPLFGIETMLKRRKKRPLAAGPGSLTQALGMNRSHNGLSLQGPTIWLEDRQVPISPEQITASSRIGIAYAEEHALLPWRFCLLAE
jgi:DNA-3-methyladenine glycosylase